MNIMTKVLFAGVLILAVLSCDTQKQELFKPHVVYKSGKLIVTQISENFFVHLTF